MFGELTNGGGSSVNNHTSDKPSSNGDVAATTSSSAGKKPPPPKPPLSNNGSQSDLIAPKTEETKKPSWLEELNRKQIQRRSGMFNKENSTSKESPVTSPTSTPAAPVPTASAPAPSSLPAQESKPTIPVKPGKTSQIKQEDGKTAARRFRAVFHSL